MIASIDAERLIIGGKSLGGRIASLIADEAEVAGLICLGYPFHPTGKPDQLRVEHLQAIKTPTLILQGERIRSATRRRSATTSCRARSACTGSRTVIIASSRELRPGGRRKRIGRRRSTPSSASSDGGRRESRSSLRILKTSGDGSMRLTYAACWFLSFSPFVVSAGEPPVDHDGRPRIKKLGTIDVDKVENSPIVFRGKLYRCEWYRNKGCFHFVEHDTGRTTPEFARGWCFANAFVAGDTVYVTGTQHGPKVQMFVSKDLEHWDTYAGSTCPSTRSSTRRSARRATAT